MDCFSSLEHMMLATIWSQPALDQYSGLYHASHVHFPRIFHGILFRLGRQGSPGQVYFFLYSSAPMWNGTHDPVMVPWAALATMLSRLYSFLNGLTLAIPLQKIDKWWFVFVRLFLFLCMCCVCLQLRCICVFWLSCSFSKAFVVQVSFPRFNHIQLDIT